MKCGDEIIDVGLSKRTVETLRKAKLISLSELCTKVENELLKFRGVGLKTIFEIKEILTIHGLSLGMKFDSHLIKELSNIRINSDW